jgi:hypothetical protein
VPAEPLPPIVKFIGVVPVTVDVQDVALLNGAAADLKADGPVAVVILVLAVARGEGRPVDLHLWAGRPQGVNDRLIPLGDAPVPLLAPEVLGRVGRGLARSLVGEVLLVGEGEVPRQVLDLVVEGHAMGGPCLGVQGRPVWCVDAHEHDAVGVALPPDFQETSAPLAGHGHVQAPLLVEEGEVGAAQEDHAV